MYIPGMRKYAGRLSFLPVNNFEPKKHRRMSQPATRPRGDSNPLPHSQSLVFPKQRAYSDVSRSSTASQLQEEYDAQEERERRISTVDDLEDELVRINMTEGGDAGQNSAGQSQVNGRVNGHASPAGSEGDSNQLVNGSAHDGGSTESTPVIVPTPLLTPLDSPVPDDWVVMEDEFLMVTASYQTHLGPDFMVAPDAKLADGLIDLQFVRSDTGRGDVLSMFLNSENGGHLKSPDLEHVKVKAFRLEPFNETGNMVVDGELVKYGPIQAQVLPAMGRIMVT